MVVVKVYMTVTSLQEVEQYDWEAYIRQMYSLGWNWEGGKR